MMDINQLTVGKDGVRLSLLSLFGEKTEDGGQRTEGQKGERVRGLDGEKWPRFHSTFDIIEAVEGKGRHGWTNGWVDATFPEKVIPVKCASLTQEDFTGQGFRPVKCATLSFGISQGKQIDAD